MFNVIEFKQLCTSSLDTRVHFVLEYTTPLKRFAVLGLIHCVYAVKL